MNPKLKYGLFIGIGSLTLIGASAGAAVGIILPKAMKLKKGLENFVIGEPGNDNYQNFANKKLYYVALGDSLTAGFSALLGKDHYSYADFLANDLKKSNRLAGYKNYAKSGDAIYDLFANIMIDTKKMHILKKADVISITVGSNDILKIIKIFEMGFSSGGKQANQVVKNILDDPEPSNEGRKNLNLNQGLLDPTLVEEKKYAVGNTESTLNKGEKYLLLRKSIHELVKMYKTKDFHELISLQPALKDAIFDLIKRNISILIHDLHTLNPHAKILFVGPYFPFPHLPKEAVNKKNVHIDMSVAAAFNKLVTTMKEAAEFSLDGEKNKFVDFIDVRKLPITTTIAKGENDPRDQKKLYFGDYIKKQPPFADLKDRPADYIPAYWKRNAFPNAFDIHPSIFGHQLIGNAIFSRIYNHLKIKDGKSEDYYTFTKPYNSGLVLDKQANWTRIDEAPGKFELHFQYLLTNLYNGKGSFLYSLIKMFDSFINYSDLKSSDLKSNLEKFKLLRYKDYLPLLEMLDDDKIIDIIVAALDNQKRISTIGKNIINAKGDQTQKIQSILIEMKEITKILSVNSEDDKDKLNKKFRAQRNIFNTNVSDPELRAMFSSLFDFLINPSPLSALNLKNAFLGVGAGISL